MTLKFDGWPWKITGHLFYTTLSFVQHFKANGIFKLELHSIFFVPRDLENWHMTLKNNRAPLLCCFNLYASFHSQWWIQTGVTVRKRPIWVKIDNFLAVWPWNLTDDLVEQWVPLISNIKLCASFHRHMSIQTGVTVWKRLNGVMTFVTLTIDLWPWPFAWTSCLSMVITPEIFRMIRWQEKCDRRTDRQTDGQTEISVLRAAWSQLKTPRD